MAAIAFTLAPIVVLITYGIWSLGFVACRERVKAAIERFKKDLSDFWSDVIGQ